MSSPALGETSHFLDVFVTEPSLMSIIHARTFACVHGAVRDGVPVRICWPEMVPGVRFGAICRIFGSAEALAAMKAGLSPLQERRLVMTYGPMATPAAISGYVMARRTRPDRAERLHLGAKYAGKSPQSRPTAKPSLADLFLMVESKTNDQRFSVFIDQHACEADAPHGGGRNYGLGLPCPSF